MKRYIELFFLLLIVGVCCMYASIDDEPDYEVFENGDFEESQSFKKNSEAIDVRLQRIENRTPFSIYVYDNYQELFLCEIDSGLSCMPKTALTQKLNRDNKLRYVNEVKLVVNKSGDNDESFDIICDITRFGDQSNGLHHIFTWEFFDKKHDKSSIQRLECKLTSSVVSLNLLIKMDEHNQHIQVIPDVYPHTWLSDASSRIYDVIESGIKNVPGVLKKAVNAAENIDW